MAPHTRQTASWAEDEALLESRHDNVGHAAAAATTGD